MTWDQKAVGRGHTLRVGSVVWQPPFNPHYWLGAGLGNGALNGRTSFGLVMEIRMTLCVVFMVVFTVNVHPPV